MVVSLGGLTLGTTVVRVGFQPENGNISNGCDCFFPEEFCEHGKSSSKLLLDF